MSYHIIYSVAYHYNDHHGVGINIPGRVNTSRYERVVDMLPALYIAQVEREILESGAVNAPPGRTGDGRCWKVDVELQFAMEVDEVEAAAIQAEWARLAQEKIDDKINRDKKRRERIDARNAERELRNYNRWYRRLWRWLAAWSWMAS